MISVKKTLTLQLPDLDRIGRPKDIVFFDIETTGLSARTAGLYLIGFLSFSSDMQKPEAAEEACALRKDEASGSRETGEGGHWTLVQYFCEDVSDEPEVLKQFFRLLQNKKILISYNGDAFDIPFLRHMAEQYGLLYPLDRIESLDLFRCIRPMKHFLGLPDLKLKTCERFLGIDREDRFSGAELIKVYQHWQKTREEDPLRLLLLHNEEDIAHLPELLPLFRYTALLKKDGVLESHAVGEAPEGGQQLRLSYTFPDQPPFPQAVDREALHYRLQLHERSIVLSVRLYLGELKFFYPNPKEYYYLPSEDRAIHQSLAEFVDRSARKRATAATCYQRLSGRFLPEPEPVYEPILRTALRDPGMYVPCTDMLFQDREKAAAYLRAVAVELCSAKN